MGIARAAPILFLIGLSRCTEKPETNELPAIGLAVDPVADDAIGMGADRSSATESPNGAESEPPMQDPVQYD